MKKIILTTLTTIFTLTLCYSQDVITKKSGEDIQKQYNVLESILLKGGELSDSQEIEFKKLAKNLQYIYCEN